MMSMMKSSFYVFAGNFDIFSEHLPNPAKPELKRIEPLRTQGHEEQRPNLSPQRTQGFAEEIRIKNIFVFPLFSYSAFSAVNISCECCMRFHE